MAIWLSGFPRALDCFVSLPLSGILTMTTISKLNVRRAKQRLTIMEHLFYSCNPSLATTSLLSPSRGY